MTVNRGDVVLVDYPVTTVVSTLLLGLLLQVGTAGRQITVGKLTLPTGSTL